MVFDIIIIAIIAILAIEGYLKGFIKSVCGLVSTILSFVISGKLAAMFAPVFSEKITEVGMKKVFYELIPDIDLTGVTDTVSSIAQALQAYGLPSKLVDGMADNISKTIEGGASLAGAGLKEVIAQSMAQDLSLGITQMILFAVLFFVILGILKIVMLLLDTIFKLPILNFGNHIGGLVFGGLQGILVCGVVCVVVSVILMYTAGNPDAMFTLEDINNTQVFKVFYNNPIVSAFLFGG